MSKLGASIRATETGSIVAPRMKFTVVEGRHSESNVLMNYAREYRVSATFKARVISTDGELRNGYYERKVTDARRQIKNEIFGEFIGPLHEAIYQINLGESLAAEELIRKVLEHLMNDLELKS